MRRFLLLTALALTGCAALPILGSLGLQRLSVSVPAEVPFPDQVTLKLSGQAGEAAKLGNLVLGAFGGDSLETRLGKALKQSSTPLRAAAAERFKQELQNAHLFGSVVSEGGNLGLALRVARWGLAYDPTSKSYQPVLDLQASLSEPHYGVVWQAQRSAAQLSADAKAHLGKIDLMALIAKPDSYQDLMAGVAQDLSQQLVEDLRQHPPSLPGL